MKLSVVKILAAALLIAGCNRGTEHKKILDLGKVENSVYSNDYFNIQFQIPEGWSIQSQEQTQEIANKSSDQFKAINKELGEKVDVGMQQTVYLLTVFQHELGTAYTFNPSIVLMAEKMPLSASFINGAGYLKQAGELLKQTGLYTIDDEFEPVTVGDKTFYRMNATRTMGAINLGQQFIATVMDGYALVFIITFVDDEQLNTLQRALESVKFNS